MPPKKNKEPKRSKAAQNNAVIENAGLVVEQPIVNTIEKNYMPYAMSVILSRAIPQIDGFKPAHRKLLYTMYKMGLLNSSRTKSANIVGQTMRLNPHGDAPIYDTMVRLSRGYQALLYPYIDSKGNFGKSYSRDMAYAASRYTEAKLEPICTELFRDIDRDTVDFEDNYDGTMKEPSLFPVTFPSVLVNANIGIAVGMASSICPFNLEEICQATIQLIRDESFDVSTVIKAPDFPGGGFILYNEAEMKKICSTGRGSVRVRSRYSYDSSQNCIEITEIPPTTTVEVIMDKIIDLVKSGKVREISDIRDETDLSGLKIAIDLKRGAKADTLMTKLFRMTPLEDTFSCNFNVLIGGVPRVMGIQDLLGEWIAFRQECVKRRVYFDRQKKTEKLHLLKGLAKILLDIDKAVKIVRETEEEKEVVPNLMIGFGIDEIQAEYVAEIKLRHLNREYILNRTAEISNLEDEIAQMNEILNDIKKINKLIINELKDVVKKYAKPRISLIVYDLPDENDSELDDTPDYPVKLFLSREGYFKKITPQSLRMSGEQKLKEGDEIVEELDASNRSYLLFFTDKCQVYKASASDFDDQKASVLGEYIPAKLSMDESENVVYMVATSDYSGYVLFFYENGKVAKVPLKSYETKTKRKKLLKAYSDKAPLNAIRKIDEECDMYMYSTTDRVVIFNTAMVPEKATKDTQGVFVMDVKKNAKLAGADIYTPGRYENEQKLTAKKLPFAGVIVHEDDDQLKLI